MANQIFRPAFGLDLAGSPGSDRADVARSDATTGPFDFSIALITCLEGNFSINSSYNGTIPLFVELYKGFTAEFLGVDGSSEKHPPLGVSMGVDGGLIENALHDDDRHDMNTANTVVAAYIFIAMVPLFLLATVVHLTKLK